jgi:hypothetical protein
MKNKHACIITGVFLIALVGISIMNYMYVTTTFDTIDSKAKEIGDDLPSDTKELSSLLDLWEERIIWLELTLPKPELERITELFEEAIIAAAEESAIDYKMAMARLRRAIADIKDLERISADILF